MCPLKKKNNWPQLLKANWIFSHVAAGFLLNCKVFNSYKQWNLTETGTGHKSRGASYKWCTSNNWSNIEIYSLHVVFFESIWPQGGASDMRRSEKKYKTIVSK